MWVFSRHGFCSVKESSDGDLMVRFRTRKHADHFSSACGQAPIHVTEDADYRFRIIVSRDVFAGAMADEVRAIDYPNFKASIPDDDVRYAGALHGIWFIHHAIQERERHEGEEG